MSAMKLWPLSYGHYRVTDHDAARLARDVGKPLPRHGYELAVVLPNALEAWLKRTTLVHGEPGYGKRNWSWTVYRRAGKEWTRYALGEKQRDGTYAITGV